MNDDFRYMEFIYLHCGEVLRGAARSCEELRGAARSCEELLISSLPYGPEFFSGPIFNYSFSSVLSCEELLISGIN